MSGLSEFKNLSPMAQLGIALIAMREAYEASIKYSCAMQGFVDGISSINMTGDTITGISKGIPFTLRGCSEFNWGKIRSYIRSSGRNQAVMTNGQNNSRVAIESIYAILKDYIEDGKPDYAGLVGNCMANQNAMGLPINPKWVELVTTGENSAHGRVWRYCYNAGVMTVFSALDMRFMAHIRNFQGKVSEDLTKDWVLEYPGHWESWGGQDYYVITPVHRFLVVQNVAAATIDIVGVTTDDIETVYAGCVGQHETLVGEFDTYREVRECLTKLMSAYIADTVGVPNPKNSR